MKAINATNLIHNLEFLNSFVLPISLASVAQLRAVDHRDTERENGERISEIFSAVFLNWVRCRPPTPVLGKGAGASEPLWSLSRSCFARARHTRSGRRGRRASQLAAEVRTETAVLTLLCSAARAVAEAVSAVYH
jgi:hypothetical protein